MAGTSIAAEDIITGENQQIRITSGGKIQTWVSFALDFFEKNPERSLVLHSLPTKELCPPQSDQTRKSIPSGDADDLAADRLSPSTLTAPRLISVVEIIKREYLKRLSTDDTGPQLGLHQYNEIGSLESAGLIEEPASDGLGRAKALALAMEGRRFLKIKKTPFMRVTLSRRALPDASIKAMSYQRPAIRKVTKSAKSRARKRRKQNIT